MQSQKNDEDAKETQKLKNRLEDQEGKLTTQAGIAEEAQKKVKGYI